MGQHTEWAPVTAREWIDPEFEDQYGSRVDVGNAGLWFGDGVLVEGPRAEFVELARWILRTIGAVPERQP